MASSLRSVVLLNLILALSFHLAPSQGATCFNTDGSIAGPEIQPCYPQVSTHSACCNLGKANTPDVCLSGGLCLRQGGSGNFFVYATGYTDSSGADPACQQYCKRDPKAAFFSLCQCAGNSWCCNALDGSESCCNSSNRTTFSLREALSLDPTPSATTITVASGSAPTAMNSTAIGAGSTSATQSCTNAITSDGTCPNKAGVIAGASIGAAIGGFLLASTIAGAFLLGYGKGKPQYHQTPQGDYGAGSSYGTNTFHRQIDRTSKSEEPAVRSPELATGRSSEMVHEVDGTSRPGYK